jgi:hypothetical protein
MQPGIAMKHETINVAKLISAPRTTKNKTQERDPEMHQIKKESGITASRPEPTA